MYKRVKKIIFFNSPSEVDNYLAGDKKDIRTGATDCLFIAMNPTVHSYLKKKGYVAHNTLPYFNNESHIKTLERSEVIIDWLRKNSEFVDLGMGIQCAYRDSFIYWARLAIHYCLWTIEVVLNAIDMHKPDTLSASSSDKRFIPSLLIEPEEKRLGHIAKIIAKAKNLKYENISTRVGYNLSIFRDGNNFKALVKFIIKSEKFRLWQKKASMNVSFSDRPVLFTSKFYQMDKLIAKIQDELRDKSFYILDAPVIASFNMPDFVVKLFCKKYSDSIIRQKRTFKDLEESIKIETAVFSYRGIPFADVISQKVKDNISDFIGGLYLWAVKLEKFIDVTNPAAIVSDGSRYDDVILAELCNKKDIPTILISHGSHVPPKNKYEHIEWRENNRALLGAPFSYLALQSPLAEAYLEIFPANGKIIRTGPLTWGTAIDLERSKLLFKKMFDTKYNFKDIKIIVHAGTPKRTKALRLYVYETPDEYIESLCNLARAIEKISDVILIIKFRPSEEIGVESLKGLMPFSERVVLSVEESFIDVLGLADLVVSFSSTTIEEALQNKIPVLLYGGGGRYQHIPAYEIKPDNSIQPSAVYHVKEARDLENAIRKILNFNMDNSKTEHLFEPYIYTQDVRTSLVDLLKALPEKKRQGR